MVPKQLSLLDMIRYVKAQPNLVASLAHPALLGHSGSERQIGKTRTVAAIRELGRVEIANTCFKGSKLLLDVLQLDHVLKSTRAMMQRTAYLPKDYYDFPDVEFYTGGSDAHVVVEIGSGVHVPDVSLTDRSAVFAAISQNRSATFLETKVHLRPYLALYKLYSVAKEALIKAFRLYEGRLYQNDDAFTNYYSEAEKEAVLELRRRRDSLLKPFLNFLTYFMVSPTILNIISFGFIIVSVIQVARDERIDAMVYFILYLLANSLTGPLARYQKIESEAGAITNIILYQFALIAAVFTAMGLDWVDDWLGALYLVLYITMLWLIITLNKIGAPIHFIIRSKNLILTGMLLYVLTNNNWLTPLFGVFAVYMTVMNVWMLIRVLRSVAKRDETSKKSSQQ
ncbi:MAG: hypothetical protein ACD_41C00186G0002 [uncultured bacterium]|nr:MAG: hypothetical protein ACD_41C00186G0002 [uncultured bacterium]